MGVKPDLRPKAQGTGHANHYVTQRSICQLGIFDWQKRVWSQRPMGLVHTACLDKPEVKP